MAADGHYLAHGGEGAACIRTPYVGVTERVEKGHADEGRDEHEHDVVDELVAGTAQCPRRVPLVQFLGFLVLGFYGCLVAFVGLSPAEAEICHDEDEQRGDEPLCVDNEREDFLTEQ